MKTHQGRVRKFFCAGPGAKTRALSVALHSPSFRCRRERRKSVKSHAAAPLSHPLCDKREPEHGVRARPLHIHTREQENWPSALLLPATSSLTFYANHAQRFFKHFIWP
jgi:hypothetical protein